MTAAAKRNETYSDEASRWAAVAGRDAGADGAFYYGVRSTRVYCRPSCPSRRPKRDGVAFFEDAAAARRAGYRACLRCRPDEVGADLIAVARIIERLESEEEAPSLGELARDVGLSAAHLQRLFKRRTGLSPRQYAAALRGQRFREGLRGGGTVTEAVYEAGFGSTRAAYEGSRLGMRPSAYKRGGRGERITYTIAGSEIGDVLVAATVRGVCAVYIGAPEELRQALAREFPEAEMIEDAESMREQVQAVNDALRATGTGGGLQLDEGGSEFQRRVWAALREIPRGETRTYREVAEAIGQPNAARAVARACAANPLALLTPCHRVVPAKGGAGVYRWGAERKKALLKAEGAPR